MKKNNLILLFILLFALTASTCKKKNYPKDIPKWLKEKIDAMEKESPRNGCRYETCRTVEEYTDGSSSFYWIAIGDASPKGYIIYNYNGQEVCYAPSITTPCGNYGYNKTLIRLIWQEN